MKLCEPILAVVAILSVSLLLTPVAARSQGEVLRELTVFDRGGDVTKTVGEPGLYFTPKFSPDGRRVATVVMDSDTGRRDLWVFDLATELGTQVTHTERFEPATGPVWSPDGTQVAYIREEDTYWHIYRQASNGEGEAELLYEHPSEIYLYDWSTDDRFLSFTAGDYSGTTQANTIMYLLPLEDDGPPIEVARSEFNLVLGKLSPDGRFLAYRSDETGRNEIFVRSVDNLTDSSARNDTGGTAAEAWQVSTDGGRMLSSWRDDGRELYYFTPEGNLMAVGVDTTGGFEFDPPRRLFQTPVHPFTSPGYWGHVSGDGEKIVLPVPPEPELVQITVFDRDGNIVRQPGEPGLYRQPALSRDGSRVALLRRDLQTGDSGIWTFDVTTGQGVSTISRVSDFSLSAVVWSLDGREVVYVGEGIQRRPWNGGESEEELLFAPSPGAGVNVDDISADGRFLSVDDGSVVLIVPITAREPLQRESIELIREEFEAFGSRFSPDGRYLAYVSDESGRFEVYVQPFDVSAEGATTNEKWQISLNGAVGGIVWREDGRELIYLARKPETMEVQVMAVDVAISPEFLYGSPRVLFELATTTLERSPGKIVSGDGQRFVFLVPAP